MIIGAGVVGTNAAQVAAGLGANVIIMDINPYCRKLANLGLDSFINENQGQAAALNLRAGKIICPAGAATFPDLA